MSREIPRGELQQVSATGAPAGANSTDQATISVTGPHILRAMSVRVFSAPSNFTGAVLSTSSGAVFLALFDGTVTLVLPGIGTIVPPVSGSNMDSFYSRWCD